MSLETVLRDEAEQAEYTRVLSKRIGEELSQHFDPARLRDASDDELRQMAATLLAIVLNELGRETLDFATDASAAMGYDVPEEARQAAIDEATQSAASRLFVALEEQRARVQKAGSDGPLTDGFFLGMAAVLSRVFGDAAQSLGSDIPNELNRALAQAEAALGAETPAAGIEPQVVTLTWVTRLDGKVCHEDGPGVTTPSGVELPAGAATSCEARHGVNLPASDWISEGLPRDARLLCSRYGRARCRCVMVAAGADVPEKPLNVGPEIARGRKRAEEEQLDLSPVLVDKAFQSVANELTPLVDADLFELRIRVRKRQPAPAPEPVPVTVRRK